MAEGILNLYREVEVDGNTISYRDLPSYHMPMQKHEAVLLLIPLERASFEVTWALESKQTESKALGAANICLIPPRLEHEVRWSTHANFVSVYICSGFFQEHIDKSFDSEDKIFEARIGIDDPFIFHLGQSIRHHFLKHRDNENLKFLDGTLKVLAQHLFDNCMAQQQEPVLFNDYAQLPCEKVRDAILYMSNNLNRNLSVEEVADAVQMSHYHFTRVFREMVGMPPAKFHTQQRIDKAKELLTKQRSILEVAVELGFSSQSHFSNVFTKSVGITPRKFVTSIVH